MISSSDEGGLEEAIQKGLVGLAGEPKHVQKQNERVIIGGVFDREAFQMSSQVNFTCQCVHQSVATFLP